MKQMENVDRFTYYYFIGVGGIGMSALARYFRCNGKTVAGYDKTETSLTKNLVEEGIQVHYDDDAELIPAHFKNATDQTLVVYTPAVPADHKELNWCRNNGFKLLKRAVVLGSLFREARGIAVAGTHGKTSVSTMLAHLLRQSDIPSSAFLGGISKNYATNLLLSPESEFIVAEADEFDRSFLNLWPELAVITAIDPDHLDIYGNIDEVRKAFMDFASQVKKGGFLLLKQGLTLQCPQGVNVLRYGVNSNADYAAVNLIATGEGHLFDLKTPDGLLPGFAINLAGVVNVENAVAALSLALLAGAGPDKLRKALGDFTGVKRRFDIQFNTPELTLVDDYGHHPEELKAFINAMRSRFPGRKLTGIFQPHLFSRTKDFAPEFAASLSLLDELILLDIYPAREKPLPGVTSDIIFRAVTCPEKIQCSKADLMEQLRNRKLDVLATMGAGDIDTFVEPIRQFFVEKMKGEQR
jgi:UDP-N-acetylmuramate--alanine ligase